ncbi:alpha-L-arabinofuranosidase C-terminal domain-containing protein [Bacteroides cellulosilyticus]|nr:alpha-L-arabinofuranosidase C-terminal domain-containing protein [Bacteroides cellulosilyticus]KAA5417102.1 alpha-L-arabinofuranosidase [Bacteroides cellulosilyticus]
MLIGVFFEDLSHAADGGLYAELIQNRDFEYCEDSFAREKNWTHDYAWSTSSGASLTITDIKPIHPNNKFYAVLDVTQVGGTLINSGFDGIYMKKGEKYDFSLFVSSIHSSAKKEFAEVRIVSKNGDIIAQNKISLNAKDWKQQTCTLIATADDTDARLEIMPLQTGTYALDMISLFPQNTFKGRKNGLRRDLAQLIADLQPRFIRFPGGCLAHGDGLDNMYDWKGSVGPLHERRHLPNIWHYHQTRGLGYFEYFQFCEDVGAEPLPIIAAGVSCQNSGLLHKSLIESGKMKSDLPELFSEGQQGGIPMDKMPQYIQDVLDLIEWANGNPRTSKWAKIRADAGHPAPFNLKYIGLGNEDMISEEFKIRFKMIYDVVKEYYPDITIIGTAGPDIKGIDYEEGWKYATELQVPIVDEHCYRPTGWYIYNQNFYDHYDRSKSKVYLGEWAARSYSHSQTSLESALAEALHMTNLERNGDIVCMTSYAPLLAKEGHIHWNPDLIYFNNSEVHPTASYYTQRMFGQNSGDEYIPAELNTDQQDRKVNLRIGQSVIRESKTGDIIIKLVNLLPISVNTNLYLPSLQGYNPIASTSILTGDIRSKTAIPVNGNLAIGEKFSYKMPQYSFTVIRITAK